MFYIYIQIESRVLKITIGMTLLLTFYLVSKFINHPWWRCDCLDNVKIRVATHHPDQPYILAFNSVKRQSTPYLGPASS